MDHAHLLQRPGGNLRRLHGRSRPTPRSTPPTRPPHRPPPPSPPQPHHTHLHRSPPAASDFHFSDAESRRRSEFRLRDYKSSGRKPVRFAILPSIFGPASTAS